MKKFRMVAVRETPWHDRTAQRGEAVLVIAAKTEAEARWFFAKLEWSAWALEPITDEQPAPPAKRSPRAPQEQPA